MATNIGAFTGSTGSDRVIGTGFGIEFPPGLAIESLQVTGSSKAGGAFQRNEAQMILAGVTANLGPITGSLQYGSADAISTATSSDDFRRSRQQGITVGSLALSYPIKLTERLALTMTAKHLKTLAAGNPATWEHQTYIPQKGPLGASARLGLASNLNNKDLEPSPQSPGIFLSRLTTLGIGITWEIP